MVVSEQEEEESVSCDSVSWPLLCRLDCDDLLLVSAKNQREGS